MRFLNSFGPGNRVDHVQITVSEKLGVGRRGGYYEEAGALRDMVQNHLLQVLALMAMEPPVSLEAECIRDEKVKLLKSIRALRAGPSLQFRRARPICRRRNRRGRSPGLPRRRTRSARFEHRDITSPLRLLVDNWRWSGVPFYLRTGKRLP